MMRKEHIKKLKEISDGFVDTTILITGATGMIGQNIIAVILEMNDTLNTNIHIIAHVRNEQKARKVFSDIWHRTDFEIVICDVKELSFEDNVLIDYIIHTVGVTGGSKQHIDKPLNTISVTLDGTKHVLDIAVEKKCRGLVYLSSLEVYGNTGNDKKEIFESDCGYIDPTNVRSSYSESKRMGECMCASYAKQYNSPIYIARLTATFGSGAAYTDNRVFAQFARSIIERKDIILKSTGATVRNYCDAEDAAVAFMILLMKGKTGNAYNVANMDAEISIKGLAQKFIDLFPESGIKLKFDCSVDAEKLGYNGVMRNVLNSDKLMAIGWKPFNTLDDMIRKLVEAMYNDVKWGREYGNEC